jgi:tetratricopeptide (TPR) repeat protein
VTVSSVGFLGRRLLSIRNRIGPETDPSSLRKLRRKEIRILMQMGNLSVAGDICGKLVSDNPSWPPGYSIMADLACWSGKWDEAEKMFEKAAAEHEKAENIKAAGRLRTGPIYRLSEARGDYEKCISLCSGEGELANVLKVRSGRLLGNNELNLPENAEGWLAKRLLALEKAWSGISQQNLLREAVEWNNTEPEWRWRFIVESRDIWKVKGLDLRKWNRPVKNTTCPVLDPRFHSEWRNLSNDRKE